MQSLCWDGQGKDGWSNKCVHVWTWGGGSKKFPNLGGHLLWMTRRVRVTNENIVSISLEYQTQRCWMCMVVYQGPSGRFLVVHSIT